MAPAHLAELRLELGFAGHIVGSVALSAVPGRADTSADFTLEEMRRLLVILKWLLVAGYASGIIGNLPNA